MHGMIKKVPVGVSFDFQRLSKVFRPVYASKIKVKKGFKENILAGEQLIF